LGLISGSIALAFTPLFQSAPWILALYPPILSIRGNVGGIFSGNLSTMLHIGDVEPKLRNNTKAFYSLIRSTFLLIFIDTMVIGVLAFAFNFFLGNVKMSELIFFVIVPSLSCLLAMSIALPIASFVGIKAFKRGLDPDIFLYPAVSTIDDVVVTLCYVLCVYLAISTFTLVIMSLILIVLSGVFIILYLRNKEDRLFKRVLKEAGPMVAVSSILATLGGIGLASLKSKIERNPAILIIYPALIDTLGDIGSIIGSMETTKLALGYTTNFVETFKDRFTDQVSIEAAAALMHVLFGIIAFGLARASGLTPDLFLLIEIALISNFVSFLFISVLSLLIATQTFKFGLDPDNFVIPLVTSFSDFGATFALIMALSILGV